MLAVTRKLGETFVIGDDIKITVIAAKGNTVKIRVDVPEDVAVNHEEDHIKIQAAKKNNQ